MNSLEIEVAASAQARLEGWLTCEAQLLLLQRKILACLHKAMDLPEVRRNSLGW